MNIVQSAIDYAVNIANDDSHGYSQDAKKRWGTPDFDCSSLVISAFKQAGLPLKATYTGNMLEDFLANGFTKVNINMATGEGLLPGDVLLNVAKHTALYIGDGKIVNATGSETGGKYGKDGDQTGQELRIQSYYNKPWDYVLRYDGQKEQEPPAPSSTVYTVQPGDTLTKIANRFGVTVQQLVVWNKLKNPDLIIVGQQLIVENAPEIWTGIVATQTDPLNIRKTPNGKIIGSIPKGERIRIQGGVSGWLKLADRDGYVSSKYVQRCLR